MQQKRILKTKSARGNIAADLEGRYKDKEMKMMKLALPQRKFIPDLISYANLLLSFGGKPN